MSAWYKEGWNNHNSAGVRFDGAAARGISATPTSPRMGLRLGDVTDREVGLL